MDVIIDVIVWFAGPIGIVITVGFGIAKIAKKWHTVFKNEQGQQKGARESVFTRRCRENNMFRPTIVEGIRLYTVAFCFPIRQGWNDNHTEQLKGIVRKHFMQISDSIKYNIDSHGYIWISTSVSQNSCDLTTEIIEKESYTAFNSMLSLFDIPEVKRICLIYPWWKHPKKHLLCQIKHPLVKSPEKDTWISYLVRYLDNRIFIRYQLAWTNSKFIPQNFSGGENPFIIKRKEFIPKILAEKFSKCITNNLG